jgi:hypothetical protein
MWTDFWNWLAALPAGSASFVGTLAGSTFGLIAILIGALVNAHLNRRRDDAIRDADGVAVASALYAELNGVHRALVENAASRSLQSICKDADFVIRFGRMACDGGNHGCEGDFGKEVCCAAEH